MPGKPKFIYDRQTQMNLKKFQKRLKMQFTLLFGQQRKPGRAKNVEPVKVELKTGVRPVRKKKYPISIEARKGLEPIINNFLKYGLLKECQSD